MDIKQMNTNLYNKYDLNELIRKLQNQNVILFIGAGFSASVKNLLNNEMPMAKDLANEIGKLGDFDDENDLQYAADEYLKNNSPEELIKLLQKLYTAKVIPPYIEEILKYSFRRIYTTNYDDVIEKSSQKNNIYRKSIEVNNDPKEHYKNNNTCIHINGSITNLDTNTINKSFKLSESSYLLQSDSFLESDWWYPFEKDLEYSSAIIFLGYSLDYDIDIKKVLSNNTWKDKTYFVTRLNPSKRKVSKLEKFGKVFDIEIEGFSNLLSKNVSSLSEIPKELKVFSEYLLNNTLEAVSITDNDIRDLLTRGKVNYKALDKALTQTNELYTIEREHYESIKNQLINNTKIIAIVSEFGNGKSLFLKQLRLMLHLDGYKVFELSDYELDYIQDIDLLHNRKENAILLIDRYEDALDIIKYVKTLNSDFIKLIVADRVSNHSHVKKVLKDYNPFEIDIDILKDNEIDAFISLVHHIGEWGEISKNKKLIEHKFNQEYKKQISFFLLSLFESSQIKSSLDALVNPLLKDEDTKNTLLSIFLLNLMDIELLRTLISEVANSSLIMHPTLFENKNFKELFNIEHTQMHIKSSVMAKFVIKTYFTPQFLKEFLIHVVEISQEFKKSDKVWNKIERELLRFHFIEQLVSDNSSFLRGYFESLKQRKSLKWLEYEPHYWLQYAMADMANDDYLKAQKKLDTAYSYIEKRDNYDVSSFNNQQARLYLQEAINKSTRGEKAFILFNKANNLLSLNENGRYDAKQIAIYKKFYTERFKDIPRSNKEDFLNTIKERYEQILNIKENYYDMYSMVASYYRCETNLKFILEKENIK